MKVHHVKPTGDVIHEGVAFPAGQAADIPDEAAKRLIKLRVLRPATAAEIEAAELAANAEEPEGEETEEVEETDEVGEKKTVRRAKKTGK